MGCSTEKNCVKVQTAIEAILMFSDINLVHSMALEVPVVGKDAVWSSHQGSLSKSQCGLVESHTGLLGISLIYLCIWSKLPFGVSTLRIPLQ